MEFSQSIFIVSSFAKCKERHYYCTVQRKPNRRKAMKQNINRSQFHDAFHRAERGSQFSYEARNLLFDYFEDVEESTGEELELDVVGICCEYEESTADELLEYFEHMMDPRYNAPETAEDWLKWLSNETAVVGVTSSDTVVYQQF
jgi:hypothetical protein